MAYRAVLFDLFDTLVYLRPTGARAETIRVAAEAGIPEAKWIAAWRSTLDGALRGEIRSLEERMTESLRAAGLPEPPETLVRALTAAREPEMREASLYPDVEDGLGHLRRRGFKLALVSNIFRYEAPMVDRLGLRGLLDAVVLSCEIGVRKPEPGIYLTATARLSVAPAECVFVGDGMGQELSGAHGLGMTAVRIERDQQDDLDEREEFCDARVRTLPELLAWLRAAGQPRPESAGP
jgi:putative hydrolase of the HAD superfamily